MADFEKAIKVVLSYEGGYSNHPDDRGGETYAGITRRRYPVWEGWKIVDKLSSIASSKAHLERLLSTNVELRRLVHKLYEDKYWKPIRGNEIPRQSVASELLEMAVNMGVGRAVKITQRALNVLNRGGSLYGDIEEDGIMGRHTLGAIEKCVSRGKGESYLVKVMNILQGCFYLNLAKRDEKQETFIRGWLKRVKIRR